MLHEAVRHRPGNRLTSLQRRRMKTLLRTFGMLQYTCDMVEIQRQLHRGNLLHVYLFHELAKGLYVWYPGDDKSERSKS